MLALPPGVVNRILMIAAIGVAAVAVVTVGRSVLAPAQSTTEPQRGTGPARAGTVVQTRSAAVGPMRLVFNYAGAIQASQQVSVVARTPGIVREILVELGAVVRRGDVLAVLDSGALPAQVEQAQASLAAARARLAQVRSGGRDEDIAAAQAQLAQAQARLDTMERGGRPETVAQAEAALDIAKARLAVLLAGPTDDVRQAAQSAVDSDRAAIAALQTALVNLANAHASDIQAVQSAYDAAQAQLLSAQAAVAQANDPTPVQLAQAEAAVAQAQATLSKASSDLTALEVGSGREGVCSKNASGQRNNEAACDAATSAARAAVRAAREALASAQASLNQLRSGGPPATQAQLEAQLEQAEATVRSARARLDAVGGNVESQRATLQSQLIAAQERLKSDEAKLTQLAVGPRAEEIEQADAAVRQAEQSLAIARQPFTSLEIEQQAQVVAEREAQLRGRVNPFTPTDLQSALAGVEQAEAQLAVAATNLEQTIITAPFAGIVGQRLLSPGALASNQSPILTLLTDTVEVHITVEEARLAQVLPGNPVQFSSVAYPGLKFAGVVTSIAPVGDARAHTFDVTIVPTEQDSRLKPGMFAQVEVVASEKADAILVPKEAVVQQAEGSAVFVVLDGRAQARLVERGASDERQIEIVSGVAAGEQVVIVGQNGLRDGQAVQVPGGGGGRQRPG